MHALASLDHRCQLDDLTRLLSPGSVTGLFDGHQWIDWTGPWSADLAILSSCRKGLLSTVNPDQFHLVIDGSGGGGAMDAFVECLTRVSRGVAIVSSRLGSLLRWSPRIVAPPRYPLRNSGPFRARTSGAVLLLRETTLQIVDRSQVRDSAMLSLFLAEPSRGLRLLQPSFPNLQVERSALHLPLRGYHPEEILGRLRGEGLGVTGSAVWYRLLQSAPRGK